MTSLAITASLVLLTVTAVSGVLIRKARNRGAPRSVYLAGGVGLLGGVTTSILGALHLAAVLRLQFIAPQPQYDFRLYALLLLGATLVTLGLCLAIWSFRFALGEATARRRVMWSAIALLTVTAPLGPIQDLAIGVCLLAALTLFALLAVGTRGRAS